MNRLYDSILTYESHYRNMRRRPRLQNGQKSKTVANNTLFEYQPHGSTNESSKSTIIYTNHDHKQIAPGKYLNDTIISFFMQHYYDHQVSPELQQRIYLFNSFFFQKIQSTKNNRSSYVNASRWLGRVNIFDKDFLFLPVCEKDHWVLVVVCYPANERSPKDLACSIPDDELCEPAVIVLNSCRGIAPSIKKPLSQFLRSQWFRERGVERSLNINSAKSTGMRLIFPDLPQQKNSHDCGVYILGYFYAFLKDPRRAYIKMYRSHSMTNWFQVNNIDISRERRRMATVVNKQISSWTERKQEDNNNLSLDSQETRVISPNLSIDLVDDELTSNEREPSVIVIH